MNLQTTRLRMDEKPWSRPPFWASEHSKDEVRRRDHIKLRRLRVQLWSQKKIEPDQFERIQNAVQELERRLGLTRGILP